MPFTGSIDSEDVDHGSNSVKAKLDAIDSFLEGIDSGTISDIDNLPGDTIDNSLIDKTLVQDSENWDTAFGWGNHASAGYAASNHNHDLVYALIDHVHEDYEPADENILKTTTLLGAFAGSTIETDATLKEALEDLEAAIESIEVGDPVITGTLAEVETTSGVTANQYWGSDALGAMGYHDLPEGGSFVIDSLSENETTTGIDAYTMPIDNSGTSYKMTWENIVNAIALSLNSIFQAADTELAAIAALENGSGVLTNDGNGNLSWVAGGGSFSGDASDVDYNNTESDLEATDVQGAIDEVVGMIGAIEVGEVNLASPGPIGGTTPAAGNFTDVTADSYATNQSATQAGQWYGRELSGNGTDYQAWEVADEITTPLILKFPNANPLANSIQIFGAPSEGKSTFAWLQITGNSKYFGTDGSGTVGIHDLPAASSGLPEGGTAGQILVKTESGAEWQDFEDHPAYTTLLNAFLAAGLNTFTFTPYTPASYPYYSATGTFNLDFEVTDTSTSYTIAGVRYQLDEGGYDGNSASDQGSNIWRVALANLTEDTYTLQLEATDNKGTPNTGESSEFTVVVDLTDPVVNIEAVLDPANPTTHDGTGTGTFVLDWAEMVTETNPASARWRIIDGETPGSWNAWASPWADVEIDLPETEEDVTITLEVTDLAGRVGTDGVTVAYSAPAGGCTGVHGYTTYTAETFQAVTVDYLCLSQVTLSCGGTPTSINARTLFFAADGEGAVFVVYSDSGGAPGTRLWYGANDIYDAGQSAFPPTVLTDTSISEYTFSAGTYWIGIASGTPGRVYGPSETGGVMAYSTDSNTDVFPVPPATAPTLTAGEMQLAIWLEFP